MGLGLGLGLGSGLGVGLRLGLGLTSPRVTIAPVTVRLVRGALRSSPLTVICVPLVALTRGGPAPVTSIAVTTSVEASVHWPELGLGVRLGVGVGRVRVRVRVQVRVRVLTWPE